MHIVLVNKLKESQQNIRKSVSDSVLIAQLIFITLSNILCWFPAKGIYAAAMCLSTYPIDLIIWTTIIGLPINSIINPSIFLITSGRKFIRLSNKQDKETKTHCMVVSTESTHWMYGSITK